jgi:hypothetical protein
MRALMTARDGGSRDGAKERAETRAASIMCTRRSFDWPGEQARSDIIKKKKWTRRGDIAAGAHHRHQHHTIVAQVASPRAKRATVRGRSRSREERG